MAKNTNSTARKKRKSNSISDCVIMSEVFRDLFHGYFLNADAKRISDMLNDRSQAMKVKAVSYRQLNSWDDYGLIDVDRKGGEWRKFSIMDALWVNIIYELRSFGYTIDQLKKVKETLEEGSNKVNSAMPLLEFCSYWALLQKEHVFLLVFADGSASPMPLGEYNLNIVQGKLKNHIRIELNEILLGMFENNKGMEPVYEFVYLIPPKTKSKK